MDDSKYIKLIIKQLSGSITPEEKKILNTWLESDKKNKKLLALFKQVWNTRERDDDEVDLKAAWASLSEKAGISLALENVQDTPRPIALRTDKAKPRTALRFMRYAAVFLIAFSLVYLFNARSRDNTGDVQQEIFVQYGKQTAVNLPDGSKVTLDAGSRLRFARGFAGGNREVYLNGEAYFEVTHNPLRPFTIYANRGVVTVLGTKFNVRAWQRDKNEVKVVVVDGRVSLREESKENSSGVVIGKGKMSYLASNHPQPIRPVKVDVEPHLAWMNRDLILTSTPLYDVLDRLSRWYDLQFRLPSPLYENVKITGTFKKKSVDHILEAIGLMTQLDYKRNGKTVVFYRRK